MCGITGIAGLSSPEDARPRLERMTQALAHRGPDAEGLYVQPRIALGHRRLSIIDLSTAASQPITYPGGRYTIIYNGEVYNYREIKAKLPEGFYFQSNSDTDVILAAYIAWGPACVEHLNGMFAFAIWDAEAQSLFIARDRLGIKPVYYSLVGDTLVFASEVRALQASGLVEGKLDKAHLSEYLRYYAVNSPHTLVEGVHMLRAGHYALWQAGQFTQTQYWDATQAPKVEGDYDTVKAGVRDHLQAAVARRLISDVPFGAFLSGGIDSSAIVALMATVSEQPVHTFSIVFDEPEFDESHWSGMLAQTYRTEHHPMKLRPQDFLEGLPAALAAMDHPSGDGLNSYVVSQATKQAGFTVALSGLGGDELFAGYPVFERYARLKGMKGFYGLPQGLRALGGTLAGQVYRNHKTARLQELMQLEDNRFAALYPVFRKIFPDTAIARLLGEVSPAQALMETLFSPEEQARADQLPAFSQVTLGEIHTYTQNVLLRDTDQMSMAHALEVRVPFFDHTLVEYALGIPDTHKTPTYPKKLLVDAMGDLLPHELVHRPKMGFVFPWDTWMRGELRDFCAQNMARLNQRGVFQAGEIDRLWTRYLARDKTVTWMQVWMLVVLENWMSQVGIDG